MYNSIYPININYRKNNYRTNGDKNDNAKNSQINTQINNQQPQSQKEISPYSDGQVNISQVLADFKNTIIAINAPEDVQEEINLYLGLVDRESKKDAPSRDIILTNLKNASKISDNYIAQVLKKQSNVVEGWITTLFQQNINLKANPNEINPDFLLKFPQKAQQKIDESKKEVSTTDVELTNNEPNTKIQNIETSEPEVQIETQTSSPEAVVIENIPQQTEQIDTSQQNFDIQSTIELSSVQIQSHEKENNETPQKKTSFTPLNYADKQAKDLLIEAKKLPKSTANDTQSLNLLNEALGILSFEPKSNENIKAALHLERGKIFDNYDYVDYALRDYIEATKASDLNLKAQAFYKLANVYDEFKEFSPALDNYISSVAYSGEAENLIAQAQVLSKISALYTKQFDIDQASNYSDLAIEAALDSNNDKTIADTYSTSAQNYQYLGENKLAIENYKNALKVFSRSDESYEQMAFNYEQAAITMEKLGNTAKAKRLQWKANQYYQQAQLDLQQREAVS